MPSHIHCIMVNHRGSNFYYLPLSILFIHVPYYYRKGTTSPLSLLVLMLTSFWVTLVAVTHYLQPHESRYINEYYLNTILTSIHITSDHGPLAFHPPPPIAAASSHPMAALSFISLVNPPTAASSDSMAALS